MKCSAAGLAPTNRTGRPSFRPDRRSNARPIGAVTHDGGIEAASLALEQSDRLDNTSTPLRTRAPDKDQVGPRGSMAMGSNSAAVTPLCTTRAIAP